MNSIRHKAGFRRVRWVLGAALVVAVVGSGVAYATVPDASGLIHACYAKTSKGQQPAGALRVIDNALGQTCQTNEKGLNWNQIGQTGPAGPQGAKGDTGPAGAMGDTGAPGQAGPTGAKGDPGAAGSAGAAGVKGDSGAPGPTGPTGAKGDTGAVGPAGPGQTYTVENHINFPIGGGTLTGKAQCTFGDVVIGGYTLDFNTGVNISDSQRYSQEPGHFSVPAQGWEATGTAQFDKAFAVWAVCLHT